MLFQEKIDVDMADIHIEVKVTGKFLSFLRQDFSSFFGPDVGKIIIYQKFVLILTDFWNGMA